MSVPTRPPTALELLANPDVLQALAGAWADSQVGDPANRHEEGGWIYLEVSTGVIVTRRAPAGTSNRLYWGADVPMRVIRRFARQLAERFAPERIILFGSHAYGTP